MEHLPTFELVPPGPLRERLNDAVLRGTKTATSRLVVMDEMDGTPAEPVGTRVRLLDSDFTDVAVLEITHTEILPFRMVGVDVAEAEGEWLANLDDWRAAHSRYWTSRQAEIRTYLSDDTWKLNEDSLVVVRRFALIKENQ